MGDPVVFVFTIVIILTVLGAIMKVLPGIVKIIVFLIRMRQ
jgi:hypothetical protein